MNKELAIAAIGESVARGSNTPCSWVENREAYIAQQLQKLLEAVIEPVRVAVLAETFEYGVAEKLRHGEVFAVARNSDSWLLYVPESGVFSLAFGPNHESLTILGFASDDALTEWLG